MGFLHPKAMRAGRLDADDFPARQLFHDDLTL
jgi:hypothetical protein